MSPSLLDPPRKLSLMASGLVILAAISLIGLTYWAQSEHNRKVAQTAQVTDSVARLHDLYIQSKNTRIARLVYLLRPTEQNSTSLMTARATLSTRLLDLTSTQNSDALSADLRHLQELVKLINERADQASEEPSNSAFFTGDLADLIADFFGTVDAAYARETAWLEALEREQDDLRRVATLQIAIAVAALFPLSITIVANYRRRADALVRSRYLEHLKAEKQRSDLLAQELSHRVKNLFAVIVSIMTGTARHETDIDIAIKKARERIRALGQAHTLAFNANSRETQEIKSMPALIEMIAQPYRPANGELTCSQVPLQLDKSHLTPLSLVINELATNALKYGCWSRGGGSVAIDLRTTDSGFSLTWREIGGPIPTPPMKEAEGFGTRMLDASVAQMSGAITRTWDAGGLVVSITWPAVERR